jgi:fatty acid desaturase
MSRVPTPTLDKGDLDRLRRFRILPNLTKIPLFIALMGALSYLAWTEHSIVIRWTCYIALGYLWMSMVTFMHDAAHYTLFKRKLANWVFGILCMLPIPITFVGFREDHIEHHRHNRSAKDPDSFTMGKRGPLDFLLFYAYCAIGGVLSALHFNLIYPITTFKGRQWAIQILEIGLRVVLYTLVLRYAIHKGVLAEVLAVWLWPVACFSVFNSMRFIAEHYGTPWEQGQMAGSRTVISNPVHSFFWNNINWHIGHHVYPSVPWYNLVELHELLKEEIAACGAVVDKSYVAVYFNALVSGPESAPQLARSLAVRATR